MLNITIHIVGAIFSMIVLYLAITATKHILFSHIKIKIISKCIFCVGAILLSLMAFMSLLELRDAALFITIMFMKLTDITLLFIPASIIYIGLKKVLGLFRGKAGGLNDTGFIN